jgi:hypothetical protein
VYSKAEAKTLRQEFWISFGKSFPRKWTLYDTKIKDFSFKFFFDRKCAMVLIAIEPTDPERREELWNRMLAVGARLTEDYLPEAVFEERHFTETGKEIARVYVKREGVNIHNKETWREAMVFLNEAMGKMEVFWEDFKEVIQDDEWYEYTEMI